ncbi:MAG: hypothetical protein GX801_08100 [Fibrobacter sp.]|nr:hypothetical protein [Fibrobacter sp.]
MNKKPVFIFISILFLLALSSCEITVVDNSTRDCETYGYGYVTVDNKTSDPYDVYLDGYREFTIQGRTSKEIEVDEGTAYFEAEQLSGYLLWPTEIDKRINVKACSEYDFIIRE